MKKLFLQCTACLALGLSVSTYASELNVGLNDKTVSLDLIAPLAENVNADLGYLYSNDAGHLTQAGLHMTHDVGVYKFALGTKLSRLWAKNNKDATVMSIGGKFIIDLGSNLSFHNSAYYTPTVLAFGDADGHYQFNSQIQYNISPEMGLYTGYRYLRFRFDDAPSNTFENGWYLGLRANF